MTSAPRLAIIADDLTGAADAAAPFAARGLSTTIAFTGDEPPPDLDVLVRSTASRDGTATEAGRANRQAVSGILRQTGPTGPRWLFKKIDSALRGHPNTELRAIMNGLGITRALVAPAVPSEQRTTIDGRQYAGDVPLEHSSFAAEGVTSDLLRLFDPGQTGDTVHLGLHTIRQGPTAIERFLRNVDHGIIVADAGTSADLDALATAVLQSDLRLLAGAAGFARQLALALGPAEPPRLLPADHQADRPVLIVAGSRHQATLQQVDELRRAGTPIVSLEQQHLDDPAASTGPIIALLAAHLASGQSPVVTTAGLGHSPLGAAFVVSRLAEIVTSPPVKDQIGGLILTGGDIAAGILDRLGVVKLRLGGEIRPAMPWGWVEMPGGGSLLVATKAGSFGTDDALRACLDVLQPTRRPA